MAAVGEETWRPRRRGRFGAAIILAVALVLAILWGLDHRRLAGERDAARARVANLEDRMRRALAINERLIELNEAALVATGIRPVRRP